MSDEAADANAERKRLKDLADELAGASYETLGREADDIVAEILGIYDALAAALAAATAELEAVKDDHEATTRRLRERAVENDELRRLLDKVGLDYAGTAGELSATKELLATAEAENDRLQEFAEYVADFAPGVPSQLQKHARAALASRVPQPDPKEKE